MRPSHARWGSCCSCLIFELVSAYLRGGKRKSALPRFLWALLIPAGFGVYCYINYRVSGNPFKYMEYQSEHWGQNFGFFFGTAAYQLENAVSYLQSSRSSVWVSATIVLPQKTAFSVAE